jgi:hypothetical protein
MGHHRIVVYDNEMGNGFSYGVDDDVAGTAGVPVGTLYFGVHWYFNHRCHLLLRKWDAD